MLIASYQLRPATLDDFMTFRFFQRRSSNPLYSTKELRIFALNFSDFTSKTPGNVQVRLSLTNPKRPFQVTHDALK